MFQRPPPPFSEQPNLETSVPLFLVLPSTPPLCRTGKKGHEADGNGSCSSGVSPYSSLNSLPDKFFASGGSKPSSPRHHSSWHQGSDCFILFIYSPCVGYDAEVIHGLCHQQQSVSGITRALVLISQWIKTQSITLSAMKNQREEIDPELELFSVG